MKPLPTSEIDELWTQHAGALMRFATVLVGPSDAHDVVVEAFLRSAPKLKHASIREPRAYLYRAVTNYAHDHRRASQRRWVRDLNAIVPSSFGEPDPDIDVQRAVSGLSIAQRAVVYLHYWEDMPERRIATVLNTSYGTVRRHLDRAHSHLRKALR